MPLLRSSLTTLTIITACAASSSYALDLYVDKKTKQIFAEPGPGRVHMGTYEKSGSASAKSATANSKKTTESVPGYEDSNVGANDKSADDRLVRLREKAEKEQLKNQVSVLDERVKEV